MAHNEIYLARPGHEQAHHALHDHGKRRDRGDGTDFAIFGSAAIVWAMVSNGVMRVVILSIAVLIAAMAGLLHLRNRKRDLRFQHFLSAGHIIALDPHLIEVWDQLREEENVQLSQKDRDAQLRLLFSAAEDLKPDLQNWRRCLNEPELAEDKLIAEARIRARLLRDVTVLRHTLEEEKSLKQLGAAAYDWATDEEVNHQVKILQQRQQQEEDAATETVNNNVDEENAPKDVR